MAASLTLVSASPYALKYEWLHDGAGSGAAQRTQVQMVADLVIGSAHSPLRDFLNAITSDLVWDALDRSPEVSVYVTVNNLPVGSGVDAEFEILSLIRALGVSGLNANAGRAMIEVRFHHTYDR